MVNRDGMKEIVERTEMDEFIPNVDRELEEKPTKTEKISQRNTFLGNKKELVGKVDTEVNEETKTDADTDTDTDEWIAGHRGDSII